MSLWDTDKSNVDRGAPSLNQDDQVLQKLAQGVTSINPVTDVTDPNTAPIHTGALQTVFSDTTTITIPNPPVAGTSYQSPLITHNLGFIPGFIAFATPSATYTAAHGDGANAEIPWLAIQQATVSTTPLIYIYFIVDSVQVTDTTIRFYAKCCTNDATYSGVWSVKFYLLRDTIN